MLAHSKIGASSSDRWLNCPGSVRLSASMPEQPTSIFAAEGTVAHSVCERAIGEKRHPKNYIGMWGDQDGDLYEDREDAVEANGTSGMLFEVTEEMVEACAVFYKRAAKIYNKYKKKYKKRPIIGLETRFDLTFVRPGMFGTNDLCIFVPGVHLHVDDYKHGAGKPVEIVYLNENDEETPNTQLSYYALGALRHFCWDEKKNDWDAKLLPETITLSITQPRCKHPDGPIREITVDTVLIMEDYRAVLADGVDRTTDPNAPIKAGSWCTFCAAKPVCPALEEAALTDMQDAFAELDLDADDLLEMDAKDQKDAVRQAGIAVAQTDPERLRKLLDLEPIYKDFLSAVRGYAKGELEAGRPVPGQKLIRGRSNRIINDKKKAYKELSMFYDDDELMTAPTLKSPAQLEKLQGIEDLLSDYIEKPPGKIKMVPESDINEAIEVNPFEGVEDAS